MYDARITLADLRLLSSSWTHYHMQDTLLAIHDLAWSKTPGQPIFSNVNFSLETGDVLVLSGKSGAG